MKQIVLNNENFIIPSNWAEIEESLFPKIIEKAFGANIIASKLEIVRILLKISKREWAVFNEHFFGSQLSSKRIEENTDTMQALIRQLNWIWEEPLSKQPFKSIRTDKDELFLPQEDFETMSWGELQDALVYYEAYVKQVEEGDKYLNLLLSTICRPKQKEEEWLSANWNGDYRVAYNEFHAKMRADDFKSVPFEKKMPILLFFAGTVKTIFNRYEIFSSKQNEDTDSTEEYPGQNFEKNTHLLAEKGIFGNYDQTRQKNCHNVLIFLEENKKDIEAREEQLDREQDI